MTNDKIAVQFSKAKFFHYVDDSHLVIFFCAANFLRGKRAG